MDVIEIYVAFWVELYNSRRLFETFSYSFSVQIDSGLIS